MKKLLYMAICLVAVMSCGDQNKVETVVKEFLYNSLVWDNYSLTLSDIDSTTHITDSVLNNLRTAAKDNPAYKKGLDFDNGSYKKLIYIKCEIVKDKDTLRNTFYLSPDMEHIVAFKDN